MTRSLICGGDGYTEYVDLDLGDEHYLAWTYQAEYEDVRSDGTYRAKEDDHGKTVIDGRGPIGATFYHRGPTSTGWCGGALTFDVAHLHPGLRTRGGKPVPLWQVQSMDPLTLSPSLLCNCGDHGWVKEGKWQRA